MNLEKLLATQFNGVILSAIYRGTHGIRGQHKGEEFFRVFRVFRG